MMNISLVIPLFNEEESLSELCTQIDKVMNKITLRMKLF